MDNPLVTVSIRIPKSMIERVKQLADQQERTIQAVYTRAIRFGLDQEEGWQQFEESRRAPAPGGSGQVVGGGEG